jgi:hypothetical protein
MRYSFSRQSMAMVFALMILSVTNAYAEPAKVVVIPLGADSLPTGDLSGQEIVFSSTQSASPLADITGSVVTCPSGKIVLGGGFTQTSSSGTPGGFSPNPLSPQASYPSSRDTWSVVMKNPSSFISYFRAYAICAKEN